QQQIEQHPSGLDPDRAEGLTDLETLTVDEIDALCERIAQGRPCRKNVQPSTLASRPTNTSAELVAPHLRKRPRASRRPVLNAARTTLSAVRRQKPNCCPCGNTRRLAAFR